MAHQDFEKYAVDRPMKRAVADVMVRIFDRYAPARSMTVLDYGCGDGTYFGFLSQRYGVENVSGCDVSELRIKRCHEIGWSRAIVIDQKAPLPYASGTFDFIISDQVIEHIPSDNALTCIKELHRVLKTGGKMLMVTPNYPIKRVYDVINAVAYRDRRMLFDDPTHVTFYHAKRVKALLGKYFYRVEVVPTGGMLFKLLPVMGLSHKLIAVAIK
jgi:SAM-dependent methyltransferase